MTTTLMKEPKRASDAMKDRQHNPSYSSPLLSRPAGTLSSMPNGGEGRGEEAPGFLKSGNDPILMTVALLLSLALNTPAATTLFKAAHVHTVSGTNFSPGAVLVRDGRIIEVARAIRADADETVDLGALHLFPGLIAADVQLGLTEIDSVRATVDSREVGGHTPDVRSWIAVNPESELIPVTRANGITHVEVAPRGGPVAGQSGVLALAGWTWEQMLVRGPAALHVDWPAMRLNTAPPGRTRPKPLDEQAKDRDRAFKSLADFFDEARAYEKARAAGGAAKPIPAWEAMRPFARGERPLIVHADDARQIRAGVAWAETNGWRIVIAGARDAWQVAPLLAQKKVGVIYEAVFTRPERDTDPYDVHFSAPGVLHKAGVTVAISSSDRTSALRNLPYEAAHAMAYGLPRAEALRAITLHPARMLGVDDRLGSIEKGKEASFFAADGDILDVRANVKRMWIAGNEVNLDSRHTRLYEKYRNRPKP
jgi:imidazolonepropionase-like amidohydrolase